MPIARPTRAKQVGVTLIELAVTIAVVAILATIAAPSFAEFLDRYRLRGAVDDVVSVVANARSGAVKLDRAVSVGFADGADWCVGAKSQTGIAAGRLMTGSADTCSCSNPNTCLVGDAVVAVPAGKHAGVSMGTAPNPINFDPKSGMIAPIGNREVDMTSPTGNYTLRVAVSPLGQARVCVPPNTPPFTGFPSC